MKTNHLLITKLFCVSTMLTCILVLTACSNSPSDSEIKRAFNTYFVNVEGCDYLTEDKLEKINGIQGDDDRHYQITAAMTVKLKDLPDTDKFNQNLTRYKKTIEDNQLEIQKLRDQIDHGGRQVDWNIPRSPEEQRKIIEELRNEREDRNNKLFPHILELTNESGAANRSLWAIRAWRAGLISKGCNYLDINKRNIAATQFLNNLNYNYPYGFEEGTVKSWHQGGETVTFTRRMNFIRTDNGWMLGN